MKLFNKQKTTGVFRVLLRYGAEIVVIFIGITISFLFDQWREENRQKKELIELSESLLRDAETLKAKLDSDLVGSVEWIRELDSIHAERTSKTVSEPHLRWLYEIVSGQNTFLFDPQSPSYLSATNSGSLEKLPDSIQNHIYKLYHVKLLFFKLLYEQQQQNITHFRNSVVMSSQTNLSDKNGSILQLDMKMFAQEVQSPVYGNFILQTKSMEMAIFRVNEGASNALAKLINSLHSYRNKLKT